MKVKIVDATNGETLHQQVWATGTIIALGIATHLSYNKEDLKIEKKVIEITETYTRMVIHVLSAPPAER